MDISDFGNDDNFSTSWRSNPSVIAPWYEVDFKKEKAFNTVVLAEEKANIQKYKIEYWNGTAWVELFEGESREKVKIHRFGRVWGNKVRVEIYRFATPPAIAEFEVYNERR